MFSALDVTPIQQPIMQWAYFKPGAHSEPPKGHLFHQTPLIAESSQAVLSATRADSSPRSPTPGDNLLEPSASQAPQLPQPAFQPPHQSRVEKMAGERVVLLARKYASNAKDAELLARLEILSQKLLAAAPRVTEERVAELESRAATIDAIRAARIERAKRLGLPA